MGQTLGEEMSSIILEDHKLKLAFVSWLAGECRVVSRKRNRLALTESFLLKSGGSSRTSLTRSSARDRFELMSFSLVLGL